MHTKAYTKTQTKNINMKENISRAGNGCLYVVFWLFSYFYDKNMITVSVKEKSTKQRKT